MQRHRHQEFIRFLNAIEAKVPAGKIIHAIVDSYAAHKLSESAGLARAASALGLPLHPNLLLLAQRGGGLLRKLTKRRLKRSIFRSVLDLQAAINRFLEDYNRQPKPFVWTKDPGQIIAAVKRGHQMLNSIH